MGPSQTSKCSLDPAYQTVLLFRSEFYSMFSIYTVSKKNLITGFYRNEVIGKISNVQCYEDQKLTSYLSVHQTN